MRDIERYVLQIMNAGATDGDEVVQAERAIFYYRSLDLVTIRSLRFKLTRWYDRAQRDLPWRRTRDPYAIWISEVMLQQTRVAAVIPYYQRFLDRFPDALALAQAPEPELLAMWSGLGYYSRARNLQKAARQIVEVGARSRTTTRRFSSSPAWARTPPQLSRASLLDSRMPSSMAMCAVCWRAGRMTDTQTLSRSPTACSTAAIQRDGIRQ